MLVLGHSGWPLYIGSWQPRHKVKKPNLYRLLPSDNTMTTLHTFSIPPWELSLPSFPWETCSIYLPPVYTASFIAQSVGITNIFASKTVYLHLLQAQNYTVWLCYCQQHNLHKINSFLEHQSSSGKPQHIATVHFPTATITVSVTQYTGCTVFGC